MNQEEKLAIVYRELEQCTSIAFSKLIEDFIQDFNQYPEQSSVFVNSRFDERRGDEGFSMRIDTAPSGWPLPQSIWNQRRRELMEQQRQIRELVYIQEYVEHHVQLRLTGDSFPIRFYQNIRQGKYKEPQNSTPEVQTTYSMLSGYLQMMGFEETQLQEFGEWVQHIRNYASDQNNDVLLRGVFSLLSGDETLLLTYLTNSKWISKYDEIWLICISSVVKFLIGEQFNLQLSYDKAMNLLSSTNNNIDKQVKLICEDFNQYMESLLRQNAEIHQNAGIMPAEQIYRQKVILIQSLYITIRLNESPHGKTSLTANLIKKIQYEVIDIFTKEMIKILEEYQKMHEEHVIERTANSDEQDITVASLDAGVPVKSMQMDGFIYQNLVNEENQLKLLPVISLSLNFTQISDIFVMFSQTVYVNKFFVELLENSTNGDDEAAVSCKLNIIRYKLNSCEVSCGRCDEETEKDDLVENETNVFYINELETILYHGNYLIPQQIGQLVVSYVVSRLFEQIVYNSDFETVNKACNELRVLISEELDDGGEGRYNKLLFSEVDIFSRFIRVEELANEVFCVNNVNAISENSALEAVEDLIQSIANYNNLVSEQLSKEGQIHLLDVYNIPGDGDAYTAYERDYKQTVQLELIFNPRAEQRNKRYFQLFNEMCLIAIKRYYQLMYWTGCLGKMADAFKSIAEQIVRVYRCNQASYEEVCKMHSIIRSYS